MLFKLIIFGVLAVAIYRAFGGKVPILDSDKKSDKKPEGDTLVECETCSTYVTIKDAIIIGNKHYCSKECLPEQQKGV
jgi:uncharacterized protein